MSSENKYENTTCNLEQEKQPDLPVEKCENNLGIEGEMEKSLCSNLSENHNKEEEKLNEKNNSIVKTEEGIKANEVHNENNKEADKNDKTKEKFTPKSEEKVTKIKPYEDIVKNIKMKIDNHPLRTISMYDSDSSSSSDAQFNWRENAIDATESSSSSSSDDDDDEGDISISECSPPKDKGAVKKKQPNKNDLDIDDLPPVPDLSTLNINVENEKFTHMGHIMGIVDKLVTVEALPDNPAYDLDTVLFLDNGKRPLGFIFDVLGQVSSPIYAIRFNSQQDIKKMQISIGMKVYSAPNSKHTQYVFLQQLLKLKGSDASWEEDTEVPSEFADFSDDENELNMRKMNLHTKRLHQDYQYKRFESTMNKRNILNTKFNKYMDSYRQAKISKRVVRQQQQQPHQHNQQQQQQPHSQHLPPDFNPSIPPPSLLQSQHAHYFNNPPTTFLPPEFLTSLANNNNSNNMQYDPFIGGFVNMSQFYYNRLPSSSNSDNYFTNSTGKDHPGPSHE